MRAASKGMWIGAIEDTIALYSNVDWPRSRCPLCKISEQSRPEDLTILRCPMCILYDPNFVDCACIHMKTFPINYIRFISSAEPSPDLMEFAVNEKKRRILFWEKCLELLKGIHEYRFSVNWSKQNLTAFPELWKLDKEIAEESGVGR